MSQRIREANRRNARRSTGPKTPEGRAASSQNALKHGLYSTTVLLPGEDQTEFQALLDSFLAEHTPATPTESTLVQQMAAAVWRLRRISRYEAGYFNYRARVARRALRQERLQPTDTDVLGMTVYIDAELPNLLPDLSRQYARIEKIFHRCLTHLTDLRANPKPPVAPQPTPEPLPAPPPSPAPTPSGASASPVSTTSASFPPFPKSQAGPRPNPGASPVSAVGRAILS
jgi:hypothetical protein